MLPEHVLVVGFGCTGRSVARVLARRGVRVRVVDERSADGLGVVAADWLGIDLRLGDDAPDVLDDVDLVVPSPGVPRGAPVIASAVRRGVAVWSEIELAARLISCPVLAVTGTNGKSTTTTLVGDALRCAGQRVFVGGNLGTPLVEAVDEPVDVAVAEVSSFQLEWVDAFRPHVAALLNVTPDHLDRHASYQEYCELKGRLFRRQTATDAAVVNRDDAVAMALGAGLSGRCYTFGRGPERRGAVIEPGRVLLRLDGGEECYDLGRTRLQGTHNEENVAAAALVARLAGASPAAVQAAIDQAEPLPHRLALVTERGGVRWYDDSKATNVGAVVKSLGAVDGPVILLAGGVDKGGDYGPLAAAAREKAKLALVFGEASARMGAVLADAGVPVEEAETLEAAVARAAAAGAAGDVVLLAPGCSSFDMFTDFAARGRAFCAAVEGLG
jgi:UDP-N-acetylmuramoylalanine--D-glutamate ligase